MVRSNSPFIATVYKGICKCIILKLYDNVFKKRGSSIRLDHVTHNIYTCIIFLYTLSTEFINTQWAFPCGWLRLKSSESRTPSSIFRIFSLVTTRTPLFLWDLNACVDMLSSRMCHCPTSIEHISCLHCACVMRLLQEVVLAFVSISQSRFSTFVKLLSFHATVLEPHFYLTLR